MICNKCMVDLCSQGCLENCVDFSKDQRFVDQRVVVLKDTGIDCNVLRV